MDYRFLIIHENFWLLLTSEVRLLNTVGSHIGSTLPFVELWHWFSHCSCRTVKIGGRGAQSMACRIIFVVTRIWYEQQFQSRKTVKILCLCDTSITPSRSDARTKSNVQKPQREEKVWLILVCANHTFGRKRNHWFSSFCCEVHASLTKLRWESVFFFRLCKEMLGVSTTVCLHYWRLVIFQN